MAETANKQIGNARQGSGTKSGTGILFSDVFGVEPKTLHDFGAFNVSLVADLPLFVDPFLLFQSSKPEYQKLHEGMIEYLRFLRDKSVAGQVSDGLLKAWFHFKEVEETWLGFTESGNKGSGLGMKFARALRANFGRLFGEDKPSITRSHHLEKLSLISDGVGRDNISDFTTNLIKWYLCEFTQEFAVKHVAAERRAKVTVPKAEFDYETESWRAKTYDLPIHFGHHVLLVPRDILARDQTWINAADMIKEYDSLPPSLPDDAIREQVNNYLKKMLPADPDKATADERRNAVRETFLQYPQLIDYFIKRKEDSGDRAKNINDEKVEAARQIFTENLPELIELARATKFYDVPGDSYENALERAKYLKHVIEDNDGYRLFWDRNGEPIRREHDLGTMFRLTWFGTAFDVNSEVNNGRGPVDSKASLGSLDKSLIEFKLASNSKLKQNLEKQVAIYEKANQTNKSIKVIICFSESDEDKVDRVLTELKLIDAEHVVVIDARNDNKPSGSRAI